MSKNLRTFMRDVLERFPGSIKVIDRPVDRRFGITAYAAKLAQNGQYLGLLFNDVSGSRFPVVTNLMSSYDRMALAMNCGIDELPQVYGTRVKKPIPPVTVSRERAPVKDVVIREADIDLSALPIPWHNALDGGPYLTAASTIMRDPETGATNVGIYRHHVFSEREMGVWFFGSHHGGHIVEAYERRGERAPFAIAIGHHPAFLMGAAARLPGIGGEFDAAGALLGEPVELVEAETSDLLVPAQAEFVIEGYIAPGQLRREGPFGEWPGHYLNEEDVPIMTVTAITHRRDAIFQDIIGAGREHLLMGGIPRAGSIYRSVKEVVPTVVAVNVPPHSRMHCYVSIRRRRNVDAKRAAFAALNTEPENLRAVIVVDDDINVYDDGDVLWAIGTRFDATRDLTIVQGWSGPGGLLPTNFDYHADGTKTPRASSAIIIDATKPTPPTPYPPRVKVPDDAVNAVDLTAMTDLTAGNPLLANPADFVVR
jgi:2,5-furandicarboxylate decarboxylase 1|uniref:Phenolic acid decarboxylase subunit C n=1 Tax=uncultured organism TaxID=155900 RepID=A0A7L9QBR3_9ZZZZ|nr:phenolic acid decarboxylase subunit C [uncultured organism]